MKKKWVAFLLALNIGLTGITAGAVQYFGAESEVVDIPDEALREAIVDECDHNGDGIITKAEMETLTSLDASYESIVDLTGLEYAVNLEILDLSLNDIWEITVLSELKKLKFLDLGYNNIWDISALFELKNLEYLDLRYNEQVSNISVLAELKNLKSLYLWNNSISDISALSGLINLEKLNLDANDIADISALSSLENLEELNLSGNDISDISALSGLKNLQFLKLDFNYRISDINALSELENLESLNLSYNDISDISALSGLKKLKTLDLRSNEITDVNTFPELDSLETFYLDDNEITDISAFPKMDSLKYLDLDNNQITNIDEVSGLDSLDTLYLNNNQLTDISIFPKLESLKYLYLENNQITNIGTLSGLSNLKYLGLDNNQLADISTFLGLDSLASIDLRDNQITVIPEFKFYNKLSYVSLWGNPLENIENAKVLLDVKMPEEISIYVDSEYVTPEMQFENFFDTSERKLYVGNGLQLALYKYYLSGCGSVEITYSTNDTDLLSIDSEGWMFAKKAGTATVTATCGTVQKQFTVTILEPEQATMENAESVPEVFLNSESSASVLDEKGTLWSINKYNGSHEAEYVGENFKTYIAEIVYSADRFSSWNNYIVIDENNQLSSYEKVDENAEYTENILDENIVEVQLDVYARVYYLTQDEELYVQGTDIERTLISQNVKKFSVAGYYIDGKVLTGDGDVLIMPSGWESVDEFLICSDVGLNVVFSEEDDGFLAFLDGVATAYDSDGDVEMQLRDVVEIGTQDSWVAPFYAVQNDGTVVEMDSDRIWNTYQKDTIAFPIKKELSIIYDDRKYAVIDAEDTLWYIEGDNWEKVAENVTYVDLNNYVVGNTLYSLSTRSVVLENIAKYDGNYRYAMYLTTDGVLYEWIKSEYAKNEILSDVADFVYLPSYGITYIVRTDGSIWQYNGYADNIGIACEMQVESVVTMGDLDGDGEIQIRDLLTILHGISGSQELSESQSLVADVDGDGEVTVRDMLRIMHYISGSSSTL